MKKRTHVLPKAIIATLILGTAFPAAAFADTTGTTEGETKSSAVVDRLFGESRYETAAEVATQGWETSKVAILAPGMNENLVDALTAAPFAKSIDAPILLTEGSKLPEATVEALKKLEVEEVYTVSGVIKKDALLKAFEDNELEITIKDELGGKDRFETAFNVADQLKDVKGVMVTTAYTYADALSVASIAAAQNMPILLADENGLSDSEKGYLAGVKDDLEKTYVLGGEALISEDVFDALPGDEESKVRLFGQDRFETNLEVMKHFSDLKYDKVYVANGQNDHLVDALVVSSLAAKTESPIVLADNELSEATESFLLAKVADSSMVALGGSSVVKDSALKFNHVRPQGFAVSQAVGLNGYSAGVKLVDGKKASDVEKIEIALFKGDKELVKNVSLAKLFENADAKEFSTVFNIDSKYTGDANWTYGEFDGTVADVPTKAVITVVYKDGSKYTAQHTALAGETALLGAPAIAGDLAEELNVGEAAEFAVTTSPNSFVTTADAATTKVLVKLTLTEGDKENVAIQYLEGETYHDLVLDAQNSALYGPQTGEVIGFPFMSGSSQFKVTFSKAGTFEYKLEIVTVAAEGEESKVLASYEGQVVVNEVEEGTPADEQTPDQETPSDETSGDEATPADGTPADETPSQENNG